MLYGSLAVRIMHTLTEEAAPLMSEPIYTRRGDKGETSLVDGTRVPKNGARVGAYGAIDEASTAIGLARSALEVAASDEARLDVMLDFAQHRLSDCSSILATPLEARSGSTPVVNTEDVTRLESWIDELTDEIGAIDHFVLPGGCEKACRLHLARTVVRRAERCVLDFVAETPEDVDTQLLAFMNRLSDLLFAMARYANALYGVGDVFWDPRTP